MTKGPVLIDLEQSGEAVPDVAGAAPVPEPELEALPGGAAMQRAARAAGGRPSRLAQWFWGLVVAVLGAVISVAAWDFAWGLIDRVPLLGWAVTALIGALLLVAALMVLRELAAIGRLRRLDGLRRQADTALSDADLGAARAVSDRLITLYAGRPETSWGRDRLKGQIGEQFDAAAVLELVEDEVLVPLDALAVREVEAAARQVAAVTALVPLALADVVAALTVNLRMIRRVAEIYGGRGGLLGSWRLLRAVFTHLVATGAVAVGDDLLEPVLGGTLLTKLSRRFGEGLVNGALSARVGVAAMEVCRPLPFTRRHRPSIRGIIKRALTGLVGR